MPICGARTRSGGTCQKHALEGATRCRLHGGKSTKSNKGNTHAVKHGFYSDALLPDERLLYERAEVGSLDDEIRLARVKLHRFVRLSGSLELQDLIDGALEVARKSGIAYDQATESMQPFDKQEIKAAAPNYAELIIKQLDIIRKLELARLDINKAGGGDDPDAMEREDTFISPDEPIPDKPIL
jgi:hypothetical protein